MKSQNWAALSLKRAPDRLKMLNALQELAFKKNCEFSQNEVSQLFPKDVCLYLKHPTGLQAYMRLSGGRTASNTYCIHWYLDTADKRKLKLGVFGGAINPYHQLKSTFVSSSFDVILTELERCFALANTGSAFD